MADALAKERNRSSRGKTGRLTFKRRKKIGISVKRTKLKLSDGAWDSPQGIERPKPKKG
jgi:hypothetical protein